MAVAWLCLAAVVLAASASAQQPPQLLLRDFVPSSEETFLTVDEHAELALDTSAGHGRHRRFNDDPYKTTSKKINGLAPAVGDVFESPTDTIHFRWQKNQAEAKYTTMSIHVLRLNEVKSLGAWHNIPVADEQYIATYAHQNPGEYWFAAVPTGITTIHGTWPHHKLHKVTKVYGYLSVTLEQSLRGQNCSAHAHCSPGGEPFYCDNREVCDDCLNCLKFRDGVDRSCPAVCGGPTDTAARGEQLPNLVEEVASGAFQSYIRDTCGQYGALHVQSQAVQNLFFAAANATHEPNRMTQRMFDGLVVLAELARREWAETEADLIVLHAYEAPPSNPGLANLHHEGRAINIAFRTTNTDAKLGRLAILANEAGMDFVAFPEQGDYLYASVLRDDCKTRLDLVIIIDASGSIDNVDFGGSPGNFVNKVLPFVAQFVNEFDVAPDATRVGVMTFSENVVVNFQLDEILNHSKTDILNKIQTIPFLDSTTRTSEALRQARLSMFQTGSGMRADPDIPKVAVVLTDGQANDGFAPAAEAQLLRDHGVDVYSVGVSAYHLGELTSMASAPLETHLFTIKTFDILDDVVRAMSSYTCEAPATVRAGTSTTSTTLPCDVSYFRAVCGNTTGFHIELHTTAGDTELYVSYSTANPGPADHDFAVRTGGARKTVLVPQQGSNTTEVFVGVHGTGTVMSVYALEVFADIFANQATDVAVSVPDGRVGQVYAAPTPQSGGVPIFSLEDDFGGLFTVSASGVVAATATLSHGVEPQYTLRLRAQDSQYACLTGQLTVVVTVQAPGTGAGTTSVGPGGGASTTAGPAATGTDGSATTTTTTSVAAGGSSSAPQSGTTTTAGADGTATTQARTTTTTTTSTTTTTTPTTTTTTAAGGGGPGATTTTGGDQAGPTVDPNLIGGDVSVTESEGGSEQLLLTTGGFALMAVLGVLVLVLLVGLFAYRRAQSSPGYGFSLGPGRPFSADQEVSVADFDLKRNVCFDNPIYDSLA